jgi:hypothetical protein
MEEWFVDNQMPFIKKVQSDASNNKKNIYLLISTGWQRTQS